MGAGRAASLGELALRLPTTHTTPFLALCRWTQVDAERVGDTARRCAVRVTRHYPESPGMKEGQNSTDPATSLLCSLGPVIGLSVPIREIDRWCLRSRSCLTFCEKIMMALGP